MPQKITYYFSALGLLFSWPLMAKVYAPKSETIRIQSYQLEADASMFTTTGYFDINGEKIEMQETTDYQKIDADFLLRYGYGHQLELRIGTRYRQVQGITETTDVATAGLESFIIGAKYSLLPKAGSNWKFAADIQLRNTFYTNEVYGPNDSIPEDEIVLGDSGTSFLVGGHLSYHSPNNAFILSGSGFFHRTPNNLSPEFIYNLELMIPFSKLAIGGGVDAVLSLGQDEYSSDPSLKPRQATGPTALFNSVDRSFTAPYFQAYYAMESFALYAKIGAVISGTSTDEGNLLSGGLVWNWGGLDPKQARIERFKEYDIEASIIQVSPRGKFVKLDKGVAQGIQKGARFDVYETDFFGGNTLIATGVIYEVSADAAILRLDRMLDNKEVKTGATARGR